MKNKEGFVYILKDGKGQIYVGSTTDIKRRLSQHKNGHTKTSSKMKNFEMVFVQKFNDLSQARLIERRLKKLKRRDYLDDIIKTGSIRMK